MRTEDLPIVDCGGGAQQRGRAHGEALRPVIQAKIERWHQAIGEAYGIAASEFVPRFLAATDFRPAIARYTPDLLDEVEGIAEGAAISPDAAYALQLMDEEWWWGQSANSHCSSLAIAPTAGRPTIVAQTMDLPRWHDGAQAMLRFSGQGGETLVFTSAGMVGLMGVSASLGVCVNTLSQLAVSKSGLPVAFVMRGALQQKIVDDAAAFLARVQHASGQNYQLGDRQRARTFECSAGGAVEVAFSQGCSPHTNHPLSSRDARDAVADLSGPEESRGRLDSLRADIGAGPAGVPAVKAALAACRAGGVVSIEPADGALTTPMTVGAVVYSIGDAVELSVCAGPPSREDWRKIIVG